MNNNGYRNDDDFVEVDIDKNNQNNKVDDDTVANYRGGYRTDTFRSEYRQADPEPLTPKEKCKKVVKAISNKCSTHSLSRLFPLLRIYSKYQIKTDLPNDAIAGFTVGIMQLPQGMAYAMLADLPPVVGLYMSFFPVLIYFLLGTSRQISMGTVAVVSLMIGSIVSKIGSPTTTTDSTNLFENLTTTMASTTFNASSGFDNITTQATTSNGHSLSDLDLQKIAMASTMCLLVGLVQVLFGAFRLGFVTTYMSEPLVSGFTTGAAVHVFTSQVKYIFGLKIPRFPNLLQIVYTYKAIITNLHLTNLPTLLTSAICIVILYLVKVQVNYRFKDKMKIPIPIELIVVVSATVLSHFLSFNKLHGIKVVGTIPAGLPPFQVPSLAGSSDYFSDGVIIGIVAFAQSVSLAALMAKKHKYKIDASQEFIAYGAGNIFGSFFSCYPFAASVSRSSVQDSAGGKSQVASLFSATLVLIVILVIGPLFESLPSCVLASIIVVALRSMFYQVFELRELWKISIYDFLIWIVTFGAVVILYVDLGLWIGLIFSFLTVVVRTQFTKPITLEKIQGLDTYADRKTYKWTEGHPGILIVSLNSPLYYANADIFVKEVYRISRMKPKTARKVIKRLGSIQEFRRQSIISIKSGNLSRCGSIKSTTHSKLGRRGSHPKLSARDSLPKLGPRNSHPDLGQRDSHPHLYQRDSHPHLYKRDSHPHLGKRDSHPHLYQRDSHPHLGKRDSHPHLGPRDSHPHLGKRDSHPHLGPRDSHPKLGPRGSHPNADDAFVGLDSLGFSAVGDTEMSIPEVEDKDLILHHIIVDCSSMCFIDTVGGKVILQMVEQYKTIGIKVFLAGVKDEMWTVLDRTGFIQDYKNNIYFSVPDAVTAAINDPDEYPLQETITHM